jgi:hypothetical protein
MGPEGGHDVDMGGRREEFVENIGEDARVGVEACEVRGKDEDLLQRAVDFVKSGFDEGDFVFQSQGKVCSTFTGIGCHGMSWVELMFKRITIINISDIFIYSSYFRHMPLD